ncbi:cupredoxin domain-containing protein [Paraburkholderia kururiensis]|uniref:Cupredoxin family copper-binding protein n=1 Tax=Paraburkholderia kururiensis TaxID=984307 RepID=A0ABZ0WM26_9BURK|nr:cupredoxin family copper-binding protein [Paraburkholderia kururiensis]WQD78434.1 cupredoxin family copper-binding protein [Paraburkholderia kururiensis]
MRSFAKAAPPRRVRRFNVMALGTALLCAALALLPVAPAAFAADAAQSSSNTVNIDNFAFSPATLTVAKGTTVTWVNRDDIAHTVVNDANPRAFKSPPMDSDDKFSFTFSTPGTYKYFCSIHPHMTGVIVVK